MFWHPLIIGYPCTKVYFHTARVEEEGGGRREEGGGRREERGGRREEGGGRREGV